MGVNVQKKGESVDVAPDDIEDLAEVPSPDDGQRMGYVGTRMTQSECKEALSKLKMPKHTKPRARDIPASSNLSTELYVTPEQRMPAAHNHAPKHGRRSARACTAHVTNNTRPLPLIIYLFPRLTRHPLGPLASADRRGSGGQPMTHVPHFLCKHALSCACAPLLR